MTETVDKLRDALLDMIWHFCSNGDKLSHSFMSAEEHAFGVLDLDNGMTYKEAEKASREAVKAAKQPVVEWQKIETAPKDGTEFIIWEPQTEYQKEGGYAEQGNYDLCTWRDCGFYSERSLKPTHWMPKPASPTQTNEG